jgi:cell division protease FtsH
VTDQARAASLKQPRAIRRLGAALLILVVILLWSFRALSPHTPGTQISLDEALRLAGARQVASATFYDQDARAVIATTDKRGQVWVAYPSGGSGNTPLLTAMVNAQAKVTVAQQWGKRTLAQFSQFILPLLILADLFGIFILLARGGAGQVKDLFAFSRIAAKQSNEGQNPYRFTNVAAAGRAIAELAEIRDYLAAPSSFAAMGALPPKGVLLYGPPGCGKTLLARALAGEANVPFYYISASEFVESLVGVGAARVRDLFRQALATAPAIIFVDELDAAGRKRGAGIGGGHDEREQTLNEMLVQMDGFAPTSGVVVIGATNRPDILDPALLRPGRFDSHVAIDLPDLPGRLEILKLHAKSRRLAADADLQTVAKMTPGFTGADLANVINAGALLAVRRRAAGVSTPDLIEGIDRVMSGPQRQGWVLRPEEVSRLAYHEAGHVVVASAVEFPAEMHRVSIVARGRNAGNLTMLRSDRTILTRSELLAELTVVMGGMAAEELFTKEPSTASEDDINRATDLARQFAGRYGMSEKVGRIRVLQKDAEVFLGRDYLMAHNLSGEMMAKVDDAVHELIGQAEERALQILQQRRRTLDSLAEALMEKETLLEEELMALLHPSTAKLHGRKAPRGLAVRA